MESSIPLPQPCFDVLIIGAGIAGLAAADTAMQLGLKVQIVEKTARPGGRMTSHRQTDFIIDLGAQFLSTGYKILPDMAQRAGVQIVPTTAAKTAIYAKGRVRRLRPASLIDPLISGVLSLPQWLRFGVQAAGLRPWLNLSDLGNIARLASLDTQSVLAWSTNWLRRGAQDLLLEPLLEGLYFQQPPSTSRALAVAALAFGWQGHRVTAPLGGMGHLAQAIARTLPIRYSSPAKAIVVRNDQVEVILDGVVLRAKTVICAAPAWETAKIWTGDAQEQAILATPFSATIVVALMVTADWQVPDHFHAIYGLLIPQADRVHIAAIAFEHNKSPDRAPRGALISVMLSDKAARRLMGQSDEAILRAVKGEISNLLPNIFDWVQATTIARWPHAMPCFPVGQVKRIADYRAQAFAKRVVLAGDYMGGPFTEGAAQSGVWAAHHAARLVAG